MSKSGRYIYDTKLGKVVKISDTPYVFSNQIWFPSGGTKYFDRSARRWFHSRSEKRVWMQQHKLAELHGDKSDMDGLSGSRPVGQKLFIT